ncbi:MAG: DUF4054 domain-containing protein [Cetobacterium sp.]
MENDFTFNIVLFKNIFKEFSNVDDDIIEYYATLTWNQFSCILEKRTDGQHLWFLVVAHLVKLNENNSVGVISSASQGSVSVSLDTSHMGKDGYWQQTSYGSQFYHTLFNKVSFRVF